MSLLSLCCLWTERNRRSFEGIECAIHTFKGVVLFSLFFWLKDDFLYSLDYFVELLANFYIPVNVEGLGILGFNLLYSVF